MAREYSQLSNAIGFTAPYGAGTSSQPAFPYGTISAVADEVGFVAQTSMSWNDVAGWDGVEWFLWMNNFNSPMDGRAPDFDNPRPTENGGAGIPGWNNTGLGTEAPQSRQVQARAYRNVP
jgi:hypothetical protein